MMTPQERSVRLAFFQSAWELHNGQGHARDLRYCHEQLCRDARIVISPVMRIEMSDAQEWAVRAIDEMEKTK